jgi:hypothetical protein
MLRKHTFFIFSLSVLLLFSCGGKKANEAASMEQLHAENGRPVTVRKLETEDFSVFLKYPAIINASSESTAYATLDDVVRTISVQVGSMVRQAAAFFEQGIAWSEESITLFPTSEGYLLLGSGISFLCEIRTSYALRNHGKIEANARRALELDPNNLMAKHLIASFYIVAPWPYRDVRKGAAMLGEILNQDYLSLNKDDLFNLYLMLQVAYLKQKKNQEAQIWSEAAAAIYPGNDFLSLLLRVN